MFYINKFRVGHVPMQKLSPTLFFAPHFETDKMLVCLNFAILQFGLTFRDS